MTEQNNEQQQMSAYEMIFLFNTLAGHQGKPVETKEFWDDVRNQSERVKEESVETLDASIDEDLLALIDGTADNMVTAIGLYQRLQMCGVDIDGALADVCENNLSKFHIDPEEANKTLKHYEEQGVDVFVRHIALEDGLQYYVVLRKSDNKVLKPHDYVGVDLQKYVDDARKLGEAFKEAQREEENADE